MPITIVPSIDLRSGQVVRLQQGDYARQLDYAVDPMEVAASFAEAGAKWMHIVDLDGAKAGRPMQGDLIGKIARSVPIQVQAGGGIRSNEDIDRLLASGVARVVVGTHAIENWEWFQALVHLPGMERRLVLALDAKDGIVAKRAWTASSDKKAVDVARQVSNWPLAAILYTDVAKDGMLQGPNFEQTRDIALAGNVPVIASGGVGTLDHIRQLTLLPIWGAIVGRSLYEGKIDLKEAMVTAGAT